MPDRSLTQTHNESDDATVVAFDKRDQWRAEIVKSKLLTAAKTATVIAIIFQMIGFGIACLVLLFRSPDLENAHWSLVVQGFAVVWGFLFLLCSLSIIRTHSYRFGSEFFSVSGRGTETRPMTEIVFLTIRPIRRGAVAKVTAYTRYDQAWFDFLVVNDDVAKSKFAAMEKLGYRFKSGPDEESDTTDEP